MTATAVRLLAELRGEACYRELTGDGTPEVDLGVLAERLGVHVHEVADAVDFLTARGLAAVTGLAGAVTVTTAGLDVPDVFFPPPPRTVWDALADHDTDLIL